MNIEKYLPHIAIGLSSLAIVTSLGPRGGTPPPKLEAMNNALSFRHTEGDRVWYDGRSYYGEEAVVDMDTVAKDLIDISGRALMLLDKRINETWFVEMQNELDNIVGIENDLRRLDFDADSRFFDEALEDILEFEREIIPALSNLDKMEVALSRVALESGRGMLLDLTDR